MTNSVNTLAQVEEGCSHSVHLLGGHFDPYSRAILGAQAEQQMAGYHVNKAFIGVCALSERGLTTNYEQEASMKRAMMAQAQQIILVCEQRKMGSENFHHVCDVAAIDMVITDAPPRQHCKNYLTVTTFSVLWRPHQKDSFDMTYAR